MFQKLFHIALVLFLVIFSVLGVSLLITGIMSLAIPFIAESNYIFVISQRFMRFLLLGVSLLIVAIYLLRHWRRN